MPLRVETIQGVVVRSLVDSLASILCDINLKFKPGDGLVIQDLDFARVSMVHCKLDADKFEVFEADREYTVGLYMQHLNSILRTCGANDTLLFAVDDNNANELVIQTRNSSNGSTSTYRMFMMDVDEDVLTMPTQDFPCVTYVSSMELQRIFRELGQLSDVIKISSTREKLVFEARGDYCSAERELVKKEPGAADEAEAQGEFVSKYLKLFAKASSVSSHCEVYLKNNYPIVLRFSVASLGTLHFCLAPRNGGDDGELMVDS